MTAWQDRTPSSRREARAELRESADGSAPDDAPVAPENDLPSRRSSRTGRRVQWDPADRDTEGPTVAINAPREGFVAHTTPGEHDGAGALEEADASAPESSSDDSTTPSEPVSRTMTRRELRALRDEAARAGKPEPVIVMDATGAIQIVRHEAVPVESSPVDEPADVLKPADVEPVMDEPAADEPAADEPAADEPAADEPAVDEPAADEPAAETTHKDEPAEVAEIPALIEPPTTGQFTPGSDIIVDPRLIESAPADDSARASAVDTDTDSAAAIATAEPAGLTPAVALPSDEVDDADSADSEPARDSEPEKLTPFGALFFPPSGVAPADPSPRGVEPSQNVASTPYGQWGAATEPRPDDDESSPIRATGETTGAITTHALVLPTVPESGEHLLSGLSSTGEIIVTGSVDLPRSFGTTGAHPVLFDHPEVDALIDDSDRDDSVSDSAPVRAIRAVSSASSTRGVIESPNPGRSRIPVIVAIVAAGLGLAGVVAIVTVLVMNGV